MSHGLRKCVFGISEHQEMPKIHVKSFFCTLDKVFRIFTNYNNAYTCIVNLYKIRFVDHWVGSKRT